MFELVIERSPGGFSKLLLQFATLAAALSGFAYIGACGVILALGDIAETRGQEPLIVTGIMKIMAGLPLYTHPNEPPFDLMQYTPLYYYLVAYAGRGIGYVAGDVESVLRLGRVMSIAFAVANLAVFLLVCRSVLRIRPSLALIAAALVWVLHAPWDFLARPDALVSLCFTGAMGLTLWGLAKPQGSNRASLTFASAAALGFVAFMAKQNGAQIVIVVFLFFLMRREWRFAAMIAAVSFVLLAVTVLAGPNWFGEYYIENALGGLNNGIRPYAAFVTTYGPVFLQLNVAALAGLATYAMWGWSRRTAPTQNQFLAFATVLSFMLAALSALKLGSAPNHYNDFLTLIMLSLAFWLELLCRESPDRVAPLRWAIAMFAILFFSNHAVAFRENFSNRNWQRLSAYAEIVDHMRSEFREHPNKKFLTVDYTFANYFPDRVIVPQYSLSGIMHARGLVDFSAAQAMLESGTIRWLLVGTEQDITRQFGFIGLKPLHYTRSVNVGGFAIWTCSPDEIPSSK